MTKPIKPNRKRDREHPPALPDELATACGGLTAALPARRIERETGLPL
jgi:hypothetical protein